MAKDRKEQKTEFEHRLEERMNQEAAEEQSAAEESELPDAEIVDEEMEGRADEREKLVAERDEWKDQAMRARAEFDNYRKRIARESEQARKSAGARLIEDLLPVMDHLALALQHAEEGEKTKEAFVSFLQGIEMVAGQLEDVLKRHEVEPIPGVGEQFDPEVHEAIMQTPSEEHEQGVIVQEFQKGYRLGDRVLRHAKVVVSSGPPDTDGDGPSKGT